MSCETSNYRLKCIWTAEEKSKREESVDAYVAGDDEGEKLRPCDRQQPMIEAQGRERVESIKDYIESPVPIQQATVSASRYLGAEPQVLEFFLCGQRSLCWLSGE